jgi:hypothetical protein
MFVLRIVRSAAWVLVAVAIFVAGSGPSGSASPHP